MNKEMKLNWKRILLILLLVVLLLVCNFAALYQHRIKEKSGSAMEVVSQLKRDDVCHLDKVLFPPRAEVIKGDPPYKMMLHPPQYDVIISDSVIANQGRSHFGTQLQEKMQKVLNKIPKNIPLEQVILLDIGANIGLHSLFFASKGYQVHAFEPFALNFHLLQCSKIANNFDNLILNNFGLSNQTYSACMGVQSYSQGHAFVIQNNKCSEKNFVQLQTLDDYMEKNKLFDQQIFLVKIDVEGHEFTAWLGAEKFLSQNPPKYIFTEVSKDMLNKLGQTPLQYYQFLESYGYTGYFYHDEFAGKKTPTDHTYQEVEFKDRGHFDVIFIHKSIEISLDELFS